MPGMYSEKKYDLAGFCVGAVKKENLLPKLDEINEGDIIIGLASSGIHSNGFSMVRRILEKNGLSCKDQSEFCPGKSIGEFSRDGFFIKIMMFYKINKNRTKKPEKWMFKLRLNNFCILYFCNFN